MIDNNLKYCREELAMTQEELGNLFGVSDSTIRGWENAYDFIPLRKLMRFCNQFDYSLDYVLGLTRKNVKSLTKINIDKNKVSRNLKLLRKSLKLSQQEFADKCSINRSTYSHYEIGMNLITTLTLYTICKTYNISIDFIVGRTANKNIQK